MGYIVHASINEKGKITGGTKGDQTGKEIYIRTWYNKPWNKVLICKDKALARKSAQIAVDIANDSSFGYCQVDRWEGYESIVKNYGKVASASGDFDCSSFVLACYILAGLDIAPTGYTGNLANILVATGKFNVYTSLVYTGSETRGELGSIYLKEGSHVVMYLGDSKTIPDTEVKPTIAKDDIAEDGEWGKATTTKLQKVMKTTQDGKISNQDISARRMHIGCIASSWEYNNSRDGSLVIKALQVHLNKELKCKLTVDGKFGALTIKALQTYLNKVNNCGLKVDGCCGKLTVKQLQIWLNR